MYLNYLFSKFLLLLSDVNLRTKDIFELRLNMKIFGI